MFVLSLLIRERWLRLVIVAKMQFSKEFLLFNKWNWRSHSLSFVTRKQGFLKTQLLFLSTMKDKIFGKKLRNRAKVDSTIIFWNLIFANYCQRRLGTIQYLLSNIYSLFIISISKDHTSSAFQQLMRQLQYKYFYTKITKKYLSKNFRIHVK